MNNVEIKRIIDKSGGLGAEIVDHKKAKVNKKVPIRFTNINLDIITRLLVQSII